MSSDNIANQIISSLGNQVDFLLTLSVAICGGIIALLVQASLSEKANQQNSKLIKCAWLLIPTFFIEGVSVLFGYLSRGSITDNIPSIYALDFSKIKTFGFAAFSGANTMKFLISTQFWTFIIGILFLLILLIVNIKILGARKK